MDNGMRRTKNVVASTWMDAQEHKSIPRIGHIKNGWRLVSKSPHRVPTFQKWWLVPLDYERVKIGWRRILLSDATSKANQQNLPNVGAESGTQMNHAYDERIRVLVEELRCIFTCISDEQRIEVIQSLLAGYCKACGAETTNKPCYCQNDE